MSWTKVNKPTGTGYTRVGFPGKEIYDDPNLTYDDAAAYYDSTFDAAWTDIAKPTGTGGTFQLVPGMTIGLMIPLTNSQTESPITGDAWTDISKPTS